MHVAFIGLGIMGGPMAGHLLEHGHELTVTNRTAAKAGALVARGARAAPTPAAAALDAEVVVTMLAHPEAVEAAALGPDGFLDAAPAGALWIDASTVGSASEGFGRAADARGLRFLEAPVAGSKGQAERAELVFFVGGDAADLERARPLFEAMGRRALHAGPRGRGSALKLVVNHLLGSSAAAFGEALALGRALGLERAFLLDALLGGPVTPPYLAAKRAKLEGSAADPEFPLRWMLKDLRLVAEAADAAGVPAPLAAAARNAFAAAAAAGRDAHDFSAVVHHGTEHGRDDPSDPAA